MTKEPPTESTRTTATFGHPDAPDCVRVWQHPCGHGPLIMTALDAFMAPADARAYGERIIAAADWAEGASDGR